MSEIIYEKKGKIAYITLNRPEKLNAITAEMSCELGRIWSDFRDEDNLWVAILSGVGESFCAGSDLKEIEERGEFAMGKSLIFGNHPIGPNNYSVWKPIICLLQGLIIGSGVWLALESDIRIAAQNARFALPEPKVGIPVVFSYLLPRHMPQTIANELLLTGKSISAQRAYEVGLINRVVPVEQLMSEGGAIANTLCENAPLALRAEKQLIRQTHNMDDGSALALTEQLFISVRNSTDAKEGIRAFLEKRKPVWKGN
jgi:enoyl-CoA hydratase/carnithine racemase